MTKYSVLGDVKVGAGRGQAMLKPADASLLVYLLLRDRGFVSTEEIGSALGRDERPLSAAAVRMRISRLKDALERADLHGAIRSTKGAYELVHAPDELDAALFARDAADGQRALKAGRLFAATAKLRSALALWRGDRPLAGVELSGSLREKVESLLRLRTETLEARIEAELRLGAHADLVAELEGLLTARSDQPPYEPFAGQLMLALYRCGRKADALETFERTSAALERTIGTKPAAALRQLMHRISGDDATLDLPLASELATTTRLAGRERELARLRAAWRRPGALVSLSGPEGVGKTRLAAELAHEVRRDGATVLLHSDKTIHEALDEATVAHRPTLLIVDASGARACAEIDARREELAQVPVVTLVTGVEEGVAGDDHVALGPLGLEAVREIASDYWPAAAGVPQRLLVESLGIPARIHELARAWTRRPLWPYKGLEPYTAEDEAFFAGRQALVDRIARRLRSPTLLAVIGDSGSGKSSVLQAGVLPLLGRGYLPGSEAWKQVSIRPGEHPPSSFEGADLVVVDQFEEVFTRCHDEDERAAFITALVRLAEAPTGRVILAIRADGLGRCGDYGPLARLIEANQVLVGAMERDELREAIEAPARAAGITIEPELTTRLVDDVLRRPGGLPLLSSMLDVLWDRQDGGRLTLQAYHATGGIESAVADRADAVLAGLAPELRENARRVLVRMVDPDTGERRPIRLDRIAAEQNAVLALLAERRLVTLTEKTAEYAHEALLKHWPRLKEWLADAQEWLRAHNALATAANDWDAERDPSFLYRGSRLRIAEALAAAHANDLSALDHRFLAASRAAVDAEAAEHARLLAESQDARDASASRTLAAHALRIIDSDPPLSVTLAREAVLAKATPEAESALRQVVMRCRETAVATLYHEERSVDADIARDGRTVAYHVGDRVEGVRRLDVWTVTGASATPRARLEVGDRRARLHPDGQSIAVETDHGAIELVDVDDGVRRTLIGPDRGRGMALSLAFSSNGAYLAAAYDEVLVVVDCSGESRWDVRSPWGLHAIADDLAPSIDDTGRRLVTACVGQGVHVLDRGRDDDRGHRIETPVRSATLSPDGLILVTGDGDGEVTAWFGEGWPRQQHVFRLGLGAVERVRFGLEYGQLAFSCDDGPIRAVDGLSSMVTTLRGHRGRPLDVRFAPEPGGLVSAGADGTVRAWSIPAHRFHYAEHAAVSSDGSRFVTVDDEHRATLQAIGDEGTVATRELGRLPSFAGLAPDGRQVIFVLPDAVEVWSPPGAVRQVYALAQNARTGGAIVRRAALDPANRRIAVVIYEWGSVDGLGGDSVVIRDLAERDPDVRLGPLQAVEDVAFDASGERLLTADRDGRILIWDPRAGTTPIGSLDGHDGPVASARFDGSGARVVSAGADGLIRVWPLDGGAPTVLRGHDGAIRSALFTLDGTRIVSAGLDGTIRLWDPSERTPLLTLHEGAERVEWATLGPDGAHVVAYFPSVEAVRVEPCEALGTVDELLAIAATRIAAPLSEADRARYLEG